MAQRFLSNIKVNDAYTLPASDGTNGQAITTDGSGTLSFSDIAVDEAPAVGLTVKNVSGGALAIGTVVHPSPTASPPSGNVIEVIAADNSAASTMPAIGVLKAALADDAEGTAIALGRVSGLNTSSYTAGDSLYVNTSGGFTTTKPTGTALIQKIGIVVKSHASSGTIEVFGANRTNDVPNIAENYIWLGNSSGVATATEHLLNNVKDVTTSSPTDGQVLTWDNANSYWKNADASSGGGGSETGTVTIEKDVFDGTHATDPTDGLNTTFGLTSAPAGKNNLQVYVDGVYQAKENFSLSGSTLTISPAPPSGVELEVIHIKAITGQISLDKFDGDNSTTAFSMSQSINNENNLQVYINGVYQSKDTYSTSGSTLTLTTAPATGAKIEVVHIKPVDVTSLNSEVFTGNGTKTAYDLTATPSNAAKTLVFIQGVYQEKSTYSISGNTITFTTAPPDGYTIEVTVFGKLAVSENTVTVERFTGNNTKASFVLTASPSANNVDVYISGLYQNKNSYTYSAGTITFDEAPDTGAVVEAKYIANITQVVAADNDFYKFQWVSSEQTANFTAVANRGYFVDTSSSGITVTLPSSPSVGDTVALVDYASNASTNNITITSSNDIMDSSANKIINYDNGAVELIYSGSTKGWLVASAANETATALAAPNVSVDYLVIAGGGSGGSRNGANGSGSGGGGAGGLLTSFGDNSGGGASSGNALSLNTSTNYTVTVGTGGTGISSPANTYTAGNSGGNSVFSTITATGGGGGGSGNGTGAIAPKTGGSGGGSGYSGTGASATSSPVQGYAGGNPPASVASPYGAGGGGGAGSVGGNATSSAGGAGGSGLSVSITGSAVTYAAGGDGSIWTDGSSSNAAANKGNGGDAAATGASGNGGSGVVILRYPDSFTISETTSPAVLTFSTDSSSVTGYKITTFTAGSNGTIQFS